MSCLSSLPKFEIGEMQNVGMQNSEIPVMSPAQIATAEAMFTIPTSPTSYDDYILTPSFAANEFQINVKSSLSTTNIREYVDEDENYGGGADLTMFMSPATTDTPQYVAAPGDYDCTHENYFRFEPEAIAKFNGSFKLEHSPSCYDGYFSYEESDCCSSPDASPSIDPWVSCFKFTGGDDQCSSTPLPTFNTISRSQPQQQPAENFERIIDNFDTTYLDLNLSPATVTAAAKEETCDTDVCAAVQQTDDVKPIMDDLDEFQCCWDGCDINFTSQKTLVAHIEKSHVEGKKGEEFTCFWRECVRKQKPFNARYKLLIHMRVHSGEKPNRCPVSSMYKL